MTSAGCTYEYEAGGATCGRPTAAGEPSGAADPQSMSLCICHLDDPEKSRPLFDAAFEVEARANANFRGWVFPERMDVHRVVPSGFRASQGTPVDFTQARFQGSVSFSKVQFDSRVEFKESQFAGPADFSQANFRAGVRFVGVPDATTFSRSADFRRAHFGSAPLDSPPQPNALDTVCEMVGVVFSETADFAGVEFSDDFAFTDVDWRAGVSLRGAVVWRSITISRARADSAQAAQLGDKPDPITINLDMDVRDGASMTLSGCKWPQNVAVDLNPSFGGTSRLDVNDCDFLGTVNAERIVGGGGFKFQRVTIGSVSFEEVPFPPTLFEEVTFQSSAKFKGADVSKTTFRNMSLKGVRFAQSESLAQASFENILDWHLWPGLRRQPFASVLATLRLCPTPRSVLADELDARAEGLEWEQRLKCLQSVKAAYAGLRGAFELRKDFAWANEMYANEMEMRRLASSRYLLRRTCFSIHGIYGAVSLYGTRWTRPIAWFIVMCVLFALLYQIIGFNVRGLSSAGVSAQVPPSRYVAIQFAPPDALIRYAPDLLGIWGDSLTYSVLVAGFTGRDLFGVPASGFGGILQTVESLLGPLLFGLAVLAVRRKYER
jgi:uncharacterized protein YjbI with pentapeptide repeats